MKYALLIDAFNALDSEEQQEFIALIEVVNADIWHSPEIAGKIMLLRSIAEYRRSVN